MEFVKEFAIFLHQNGIIKFGDFTLASGKKSSYYVDLRMVPSYPHEFRKMIKYLEKRKRSYINIPGRINKRVPNIVTMPTIKLTINTRGTK